MQTILKTILGLTVLVLTGCGSGGGGSSEPNWYYHFICNGDADCLATNFAGTSSGTSESQGSGNIGSINCQSLITFGNINWGPSVVQWCDNSTGLTPPGGSPPTVSNFTPLIGEPGTTVTITGSNFPTTISDITVTVSGFTAVVNSASSTQLVITIPSMGNLTGPISVTTPGGTATSTELFTVFVPNPLAAEQIKKVAPGYTHTCAILADNSVNCFGSNESGQLGDGTTTSPPGVVTVTGVSNPIDIAVGISFSCGIFGTFPEDVSGPVKCWGKGTSGQLGNNTNTDSVSPVSVTSLNTAIQISARANHVCALLLSGQVMCWGEGTSGQLGNGGMANSPVPVAVLGTGPDNYTIVDGLGQPSSTKAFQVSAGDAHTCARVSILNGSAGLGVKCWGVTNHGELGNGAPFCQVNTICDPKAPNPNPQYVAQVTSAAHMAAGAHHTCVVLTFGQLRCWGQGDKGQLGNNTTIHSNSQVVVFSISGATAVSAGSEFSCASDSGALKCWGDNSSGQLGNGGTTNSTTQVLTTAIGSGDYDPTTLMSGHLKTCMKLASDNTAFCFP